MPWRSRIPRELRDQLDEVAPSAIAEYLADVFGLTVGRRELRFKLKDGRYQRVEDERGRPIGDRGVERRRGRGRPIGP
jgi:hypothetical protein